MTDHRRALALLVGVSGALLVSVLAGGVEAGSQRSSLRLVAEFADASPIIAGNEVKVDGVIAGQVKKVELRGGKGLVTFSLGPEFAPVHADATIRIRPVTLLGERFLDLDRGSGASPPLANGGIIPVHQTTRAVDLQDVLDTVDQPTGTALAALLVGLGEGVADHGDETADVIEALRPALERTDDLLKILGGQNQLIASLVDKAEPVASALAAQRGERLDALVGAAGEALNAVAAGRPGLEEGLRRLPAALDTARTALRQVSTLAGEATPVLHALRPVTDNLSEVAVELTNVTDAANPALASLGPVLDRADDLLGAARPVATELKTAGGDLRHVGRSARTLVEALPPDLGNVLDAVRNLALATSGHDGLSYYIRTYVFFRQQSAAALASPGAPPAGPAPAPPRAVLHARSDSAAAGADTPATYPAPPIPSPATVPDPESATGLTVSQEKALLRYLLGVD